MEFTNGGFEGSTESNDFCDPNGETKEVSNVNTRMDRYRISDDQWKKIEERMNKTSIKENPATPERSNSTLSKYRVSGEQWEHVEKHLKSNGIDPGIPPTDKKYTSVSKPTKINTRITRQTSAEDNCYAKLDIMKMRHEVPEYEKLKKSPHPQRKESSLQQKIQQRKELSQSTQSLSSEAIQDLKPLTIPKDGDLHGFSVDEMSTFFRYMRVDNYIVERLIRKKLDGVKFSKLKDTDLENIGIKNPIIMHFRDRSCRQRIPFML